MWRIVILIRLTNVVLTKKVTLKSGLERSYEVNFVDTQGKIIPEKVNRMEKKKKMLASFEEKQGDQNNRIKMNERNENNLSEK